MDLTDCIEFSYLWKSFSLKNTMSFDENIVSSSGNDDDGNFLELPSDIIITIIDDDNQIPSIEDILMKTTTTVAIDVEWRPFASSSLANKCSLLQIATNKGVYLFDLMALEKAWNSNHNGDDDDDDDDDDYCPNFRKLISNLFTSDGNIVTINIIINNNIIIIISHTEIRLRIKW